MQGWDESKQLHRMVLQQARRERRGLSFGAFRALGSAQLGSNGRWRCCCCIDQCVESRADGMQMLRRAAQSRKGTVDVQNCMKAI